MRKDGLEWRAPSSRFPFSTPADWLSQWQWWLRLASHRLDYIFHCVALCWNHSLNSNKFHISFVLASALWTHNHKHKHSPWIYGVFLATSRFTHSKPWFSQSHSIGIGRSLWIPRQCQSYRWRIKCERARTQRIVSIHITHLRIYLTLFSFDSRHLQQQ